MQFLQSIGFGIVESQRPKDKPLITVNTTLNQMEEFLDSGMKRSYVHNPSRGPSFFAVSRDDEKWTGGSYENLRSGLAGSVDMKPFFKAKNKLLSSGLLSKVQTQIATNIPKRRRVFTEYDGEWSYERVGHEKPWETVAKRPGAVRTVDLVCHACFSCASNSSEIDEYGTLAWALSQVLESSGIATRVVLAYDVDGIDSRGSRDLSLKVEVKKSGEYLSPPRLASTFRAVFYRRAVFAAWVAVCDAFELTACGSLGRPTHRAAAIDFTDGQLVLMPESLRASQEQILAALSKAIGLPQAV